MRERKVEEKKRLEEEEELSFEAKASGRQFCNILALAQSRIIARFRKLKLVCAVNNL